MAIISIPTSVAGVSIPGTAVKGPLGALFGNKYNFQILQYPRDLASATRGHTVEFSINEVKEMNYSETIDKFNTTLNAAQSDKNQSVIEKGLNTLTAATETINSAISDTLKGVNLSLNPRQKSPVAAISLYIPDTMAFTYDVSYNDSIKLMDLAGGAASAFIQNRGKAWAEGAKSAKDVSARQQKFDKAYSLATSAGAKNAGKLLMATQGLAVNPQQQLLFEGITFRNYQLMFTFTPYSQEEADQVAKIVSLFKQHALPEITSYAAGMFFKVPSTFNLKFMLNGKENKKINKVAESVLTTVDVNYTPNGWSTYSDGSPVQTILTLNFREIELIDRTKIKEGY